MDRAAALLTEAQRRGLLGPGPVEAQIDHAIEFCHLVEAFTGDPPSDSVLDLGSGGGLPGIIAALEWDSARIVLLDAKARSADFLAEAVEALGLDSRVEVVNDRAESAARDPRMRERFELVVARSVAPPPTIAELATGFIKPGGALAVSEPPADATWDDAGCTALRLRVGPRYGGESASVRILEKTAHLDDRWPRRVGVPGKRPLW